MNEAFPEISKIQYEGPKSKNPLAFKHYNAEETVEGKTMRNHLRFSVVYRHTFRLRDADMFSVPTMSQPWDDNRDSLDNAKRRVRVAFEFIEKLGASFYAFHDRDVVPQGSSLSTTNKNFDAVTKALLEEQKRTGIGLLWGSTRLVARSRYARGTGTSCNADAFAYAANQVKKALEVTHQLGGAGYVFWGGREGYSTLFNIDLKRELDHFAKFLHLAVEHKKKIGFKGQFYIEPKPNEPTKHLYDSDAAACLNFLREYDLLGHFKLNLETNHTTLEGHMAQRELETAGAAGALGSIDANTGDLLPGWDTDQCSTAPITTKCMEVILNAGGLGAGGITFDAKAQHHDTDVRGVFQRYIRNMDAFARAIRNASAIRKAADDLTCQLYRDMHDVSRSEVTSRVEPETTNGFWKCLFELAGSNRDSSATKPSWNKVEVSGYGFTFKWESRTR